MRPAVVILPFLAACASVPMTPEKALRLCQAEVGQADGISGSIGAGISNSGPIARGNITVTNRVLNPQTEAEFLKDCIDRRMAGEPEPTTFGVSIGGRT